MLRGYRYTTRWGKGGAFKMLYDQQKQQFSGEHVAAGMAGKE